MGHLSQTPSTKGPEIIAGQVGGKILRTRGRGGRCFWDMMGLLHTWTHNNRDSMPKTCTRSNQPKILTVGDLGSYEGPPASSWRTYGQPVAAGEGGFQLASGTLLLIVAHALEDGILHILAALNGLSGLKRGQEVGRESGRRCEKIWSKHSMPMWNSQIINKKEKHSIPCLFKLSMCRNICVWSLEVVLGCVSFSHSTLSITEL